MKNFLKVILLVYFLLVNRGHLLGQTTALKSGNVRITAYVELDDDATDRTVPYSQINYLNIAFVNPDKKTGQLVVPEAAKQMIADAKADSVKVMAVIGGRDIHGILYRLIKPKNLDAFIANIIQVLDTNQFNGVDIDFENHLVNRDYPGFISALAAALKPLRLELTVAVCTDFVNNKKYLHPGMLKDVDFVNIMSYDKYDDNQPRQQASYELADADIKYWRDTMLVPHERIGVGVPFYGNLFYRSGNGYLKDPNEFPYRNIVSHNNASADSDTVHLGTDSIVYYNGLAMITRKAKLALDEVGGLMIWKVYEDVQGNNSLLGAIHEVVDKKYIKP